MADAVIYSMRDPRNGAVRYVGKAINLKRRISNHVTPSALKNIHHRGRWLADLIRAGFRPIVEVLEYCSDNWESREMFWIHRLRAAGNDLTNTTTGGEGGTTIPKGTKRPAWIIEKMVKASADARRGKSGKPWTQESREKLSKAMTIAWAAQKARGVSTRLKCHSETTKRLIGEKNKGRKPSPLAISKSISARLGKPLSEKHKAAQRASQLGRRFTDEEKAAVSAGLVRSWKIRKGLL